MKKPSFVLTAWAAFLLITVLCQTDFAPAGRMPSTGRVISAGLAAPTPPVEYTLKLPLLVDSGDGRLYGLVAAGGQDDRIAVYSSRDGHPLANYSYKAPFTLDVKRHRLFVMSSPDRVAVVDARTGKPLATFRLGNAAESPALLVTPQYDPQANQLLVFTGNVMTTLDANTGKQLGTTEPYSGQAAKGGFYAMAWHRFGIGAIWTERDGKPGYRTAGWSAGDPFQLDTRRGRLYQSGDGSVRILNPAGMTLAAVAPQPVRGVLAAYDPESDQVYFVDGATVRPWPAAKLGSTPASPSKVKGTPHEPVRLIVPAPNWQQEKTLFAVWSRPWPDMTCYVFNQSGGDMLWSRDGRIVQIGPPVLQWDS